MRQFIKRSIFINLLLFLLASGALYGVFGVASQAVRFWREFEDTRAQIRELTQKKEELERYLEEIQTPQVIEREAKERLNLKRPGEEVVVVPESVSPESERKPRSWLEKIKSVFFER